MPPFFAPTFQGMATVIDICNLALARLGDDATVASIDPPENSPQAAHCARFYPMSLATLVSMHPWSFCTARAALAPLAQPPAGAGWAYGYAAPAGLQRVISVHAPGSDVPQPYAVEAQPLGDTVILSDTPRAWLRYLLLPQDPARFPPLFTDALVMLLASALAGPLIKGDAGAAAAKRCLDYFYSVSLPHARAADVAQQRGKPLPHAAPWMAAR